MPHLWSTFSMVMNSFIAQNIIHGEDMHPDLVIIQSFTLNTHGINRKSSTYKSLKLVSPQIPIMHSSFQKNSSARSMNVKQLFASLYTSTKIKGEQSNITLQMNILNIQTMWLWQLPHVSRISAMHWKAPWRLSTKVLPSKKHQGLYKSNKKGSKRRWLLYQGCSA